LLNQIVGKAIPEFEAQFPGSQALFAIDNAHHHLKYANNTFRVSEMNLEPSGNNSNLIEKTFVTNQRHPGEGYIQSMTFPNPVPKELKVVLTQRGFWLVNGT